MTLAPPPSPRRPFQRPVPPPHRILFRLGACIGSALAMWWALALSWHGIDGAWRSGAWPWAAPPTTAHSLVMTFGIFPWFIAGVAHTAGPRWLRVEAPPLRHLTRTALIHGIGLCVWVVGLHVDLTVAAGGLGLSFIAWMRLTWAFIALYRRSTHSDRLHAAGLAWGMGIIGWAFGIATVAGGTGWQQGLQAAAHLALWGGVATVYGFALHRMTPFLHLPHGPVPDTVLLALLLLTFAFQAARTVCQDLGLVWPHLAVATAAALQTLVGLTVMGLTLAADIRRAARTPMMRHLRLGARWLSVSLCGFAAFSLPPVRARWPGLEAAALHGMVLGFMGTTLLAMATRIAATHSGRAVVIDAHGERLHRLLQGVAVARIAAALWPEVSPLLLSIAAFGWSLLWGLWATRWVPVFRQAPKSGPCALPAITPARKPPPDRTAERPAPPPDRSA